MSGARAADPVTPEITLPDVEVTAAPEPPRIASNHKFWFRDWRLLITNETQGKTDARQMDLSALRIVFNVKHRLNQTPKTLHVSVYNVGQDTITTILKEYTTVKLLAGYKGTLGTIFDGALSYFEHGRMSPTETVLTMEGNDSDPALNGIAVNQTLEKGHTARNVVDALIARMGLKAGFITKTLDPSLSPRGRALVGMPKDILRDIAEANNAAFSVDDGKVNIVGYTDVMSDTAIVLNSNSGMIGTPKQTMGGSIEVTSLLNARLKVGSYLKIAEGDIVGITQAAPAPAGFMQQHQVEVDKNLQMYNKNVIRHDGFYKVLEVDHDGDTHGGQWYSRLTTETINPAASRPAPR